jgi:hypothetical protein
MSGSLESVVMPYFIPYHLPIIAPAAHTTAGAFFVTIWATSIIPEISIPLLAVDLVGDGDAGIKGEVGQ